MASTNKTPNYELSQFVETDRPAWLTDYNGDMRTLDTALKAVSDVASGASGSISELADRMSTAEGNITTNANDIDALEARADSLEAQAQSTAGTIAGIQTEQTVQNTGIEAATELGYNLARPYDSASTYAVGAYVLFQNTLYKCVTPIATGEAFDPTKWLAIKATDEIAAGGVTIVPHTEWTINNPTIKAGQGVTLGNATSVKCNAIRINNTQFFSISFLDIPGVSITEDITYFTITLPIMDRSYKPITQPSSKYATSCGIRLLGGTSGTPNGEIPCYADLSWDGTNNNLVINFQIRYAPRITNKEIFAYANFLYGLASD